METQGGFLMSQIKQVGSRIFEKLLKEHGMDAFNGAQGRILYVLWQNSPLPISSIAKQTSLAKTTLTSMLDRMEEKGLVRRTHNPQNRREVLIHLTLQATKLQADYNAISGKTNDIYYHGFTETEVWAFEQQLQRVLANLEAYEQNTGK